LTTSNFYPERKKTVNKAAGREPGSGNFGSGERRRKPHYERYERGFSGDDRKSGKDHGRRRPAAPYEKREGRFSAAERREDYDSGIRRPKMQYERKEGRFSGNNRNVEKNPREMAKAREELRKERFRAQERLMDGALRQAFDGIFRRKIPADLVLAEIFRSDRRCGSRDRAAMGAGVYAVLRHWGLLRMLLPEDIRSELEKGSSDSLDHGAVGALLVAALIVDGGHDELAKAVAAEFDFKIGKIPSADSPWKKRAAAACEFAGIPGEEASELVLLPEWVKESVPADFQLSRWAADLASRPPMWLRLQGEGVKAPVVRELEESGAVCRFDERCPGALAVSGSKLNLFTLEGYRSGKFEVQDLASQCVGLVCAPKKGERWYDPCAGAGGKTLQLAELMERRGVVLAGDIREKKIEELRRRARRGGFPNISAKAHDGRPPRGMHQVDGLLIDAPCSGSGVWRRNPCLQWSMVPEDIKHYTDLQSKILDSFVPVLKPGGVLVYATCSVFEAENEGVIRAFLERHDEFVLESFRDPLTGGMTDGFLRINSFDGNCDTLFAARLRRRIR